MPYVNLNLLIIIFAFALVPKATGELSYVSQKKTSQLRQRFAAANEISADNLDQILEKTWICSLFGMRTRMQEKKNLKLYRLIKSDQGLENEGTQVVKKYVVDNEGLKGVNGSIEDHLRLAKSNRLIAKLNLVKNPKASVVAYASCRVQ